MTSLVRYGLTALLLLVGALASGGLVVLAALGPKFGLVSPLDFAILPFDTLLPLLLGWLINRKYPGHIIAFLFYVMALFPAVFFIFGGLYLLHLEGVWTLPPEATSAIITLGETTWQPNVTIPIFLMPLFFPTGKLLSPRWRLVVALYVFILVFNLLAITLVPWPSLFVGPSPYSREVNGAAVLAPIFEAAVPIVGTLFGLLFLLVLLAVILRFRRSDAEIRAQIKWPIWAVLFTIGFAFLRSQVPGLNAIDEQVDFMVTRAMGLLFPLSLGIAVWRHRLWDIDLILRRTLVYGILTAFILLTYIGAVSGLSALFNTQMDTEGGLLATVIVAVLFQPLRGRLQRVVSRLLYGARDDPAAVLSGLTQQLQRADPPDEVLPELCETIAHSLKLPYVAIELANKEDGLVSQATWGRAPLVNETMPLQFRGQILGHLVVSPRDANGRFGERDRALLESIAALTANVVHAVQLSEALRQSRQRIVSAREEERRRLRRDLHDGLGPQLASQTLGLEAVSQIMAADPAGAQKLLDSLKQQSHEATEDVRRLVYDLRPPTLDELGLEGALRQSAARLGRNGLAIAFDLSAPLMDLPAAVETAAYRIVQEAMTNVVHHAQATQAIVSLRPEGAYLRVVVRDDGIGLAPEYTAGVGLQSIRERAAELNGRARIERNAGGGTTVEAWLPLTGAEVDGSAGNRQGVRSDE